jgi:site-specific DNA-methyltransferase (adenine-specific)
MTAQLYHTDSMKLLSSLPSDSVDAIITDPPYSSGGFTRADRNASPNAKYVQGGQEKTWASFSGDNRDARSWQFWCQLWVSECLRIVKPGGYFLTFTDWRQLPITTDYMQAGGFVWHGIIAWNKGRGARAPHTGFFRHQCEYIVWGTKGQMAKAKHGGPFDGCFEHHVRQSDKFHLTGKPTPLMVDLVAIVPPGGVVLDPFMGSGSTGVACIQTGRQFIGVELDDHYFTVAQQRIAEAESGAA